MKHPFFSIIIPTYNRAHLIKDTITSVQAQTFENWECIVIDDGSTDNTKEVIEDIAKIDNRVRYIYQENAERSAARNNGINNAKGEYICFLDSDDWYLENHLNTLHKTIKNADEKECLLFVNALQDTNGKETPILSPKYDKSTDYFLKVSIIPARICIHHSILKRHQFDPEIVIVEDSVLWTQIHLEYPVIQISDTTIVYRWHEDNSVNIKNNCFLPRLKGLKRLFASSEIQKKISILLRRNHLSNCYYGIAKHHAFRRNFFKMLVNVFYSIFLDPSSPQTKAKIYMLYAFFRKPDISYL